MIKNNQTSIDLVLHWFDENFSQWSDFYHSLNKEHRDRLTAWRKNKELPQLNSIKLLPGWSSELEFDSETAHTIKALLLIARVLDWARKSRIIVADANASYESKFGAHFSKHQAHWFNG